MQVRRSSAKFQRWREGCLDGQRAGAWAFEFPQLSPDDENDIDKDEHVVVMVIYLMLHLRKKKTLRSRRPAPTPSERLQDKTALAGLYGQRRKQGCGFFWAALLFLNLNVPLNFQYILLFLNLYYKVKRESAHTADLMERQDGREEMKHGSDAASMVTISSNSQQSVTSTRSSSTWDGREPEVSSSSTHVCKRWTMLEKGNTDCVHRVWNTNCLQIHAHVEHMILNNPNLTKL